MPWLSLQPMLAKASKDRNNAKVIKYKHFLARYQVIPCLQPLWLWRVVGPPGAAATSLRAHDRHPPPCAQVLLNHQLVDSWEDLLVREVCQKLYDSGENLCEEFKKVRGTAGPPPPSAGGVQPLKIPPSPTTTTTTTTTHRSIRRTPVWSSGRIL
jgi:hypothetical protein